IAFVLDHRPLVRARRHERIVRVAVELELELVDRQLRAAQDVPGSESDPHPDRVADVADVVDQQQSIAARRREGRGWRGKQRRQAKPDETSPQSLHWSPPTRFSRRASSSSTSENTWHPSVDLPYAVRPGFHDGVPLLGLRRQAFLTAE